MLVLRCLWTRWRLRLYVHKRLEKDSRKHSQPDEKVVRGVVRRVPEGAEHRRQDGAPERGWGNVRHWGRQREDSQL